MSEDHFFTIRNYRALKKDALYPFSNERIKYFSSRQKEILTKKNEFEVLKTRVNYIPKRYLDAYKNNILQSLEKVIELISKNKLGLPLSRNQGLIIPNYIFGKIIGVIESSLDNVFNFSYPQFYLDKNGDFDPKETIQLLIEFKNILIEKDFNSFFEIESECENYLKKLYELWQNENYKFPNPN